MGGDINKYKANSINNIKQFINNWNLNEKKIMENVT